MDLSNLRTFSMIEIIGHKETSISWVNIACFDEFRELLYIATTHALRSITFEKNSFPNSDKDYRRGCG